MSFKSLNKIKDIAQRSIDNLDSYVTTSSLKKNMKLFAAVYFLCSVLVDVYLATQQNGMQLNDFAPIFSAEAAGAIFFVAYFVHDKLKEKEKEKEKEKGKDKDD